LSLQLKNEARLIPGKSLTGLESGTKKFKGNRDKPQNGDHQKSSRKDESRRTTSWRFMKLQEPPDRRTAKLQERSSEIPNPVSSLSSRTPEGRGTFNGSNPGTRRQNKKKKKITHPLPGNPAEGRNEFRQTKPKKPARRKEKTKKGFRKKQKEGVGEFGDFGSHHPPQARKSGAVKTQGISKVPKVKENKVRLQQKKRKCKQKQGRGIHQIGGISAEKGPPVRKPPKPRNAQSQEKE